MPGLMLHLGAQLACPHQVPATIAPGQPRVSVLGGPVATSLNQITVAGCPFQIPVGAGTKPQPCVRVVWANQSSRVTVMGQPVLLQAPPGPGPGGGVCQSVEQIPQGPPTVRTIQPKVVAT
jgi:hypothetical protein